MEKIIKDHQRKSQQVRALKKQLKKKSQGVSMGKLENLLAQEKKNKTRVEDFYYSSWDESGIDDEGFGEAEAKREARIELLEELLRDSRY